ncbi:MAG: amidohydrolase family protein, partial [Gemmatimonadales bacterium]
MLRSWAVIALCWTLPADAQVVAATGGTVIDATGRAPIQNGVVLIRDGRIVAVGPASTVTIPANATRIDAGNGFVIPGLMDANLHLYLNGDLESLIRYEGRYHEIILEAAQIALRAGLTTVFDTWGPRAPLIQARDAVNAGQAPGSRFYIAGNIIGFTGPLGADFRLPSAAHASGAFVKRTNALWEEGTGRDLLWLTPDSVRQVVRSYTRSGVNFLKYGASGHVDMNLISFSERVQRAIVEEGRRAGMTVQAHTTSVESLDMAIEAGVNIVTHGDISGPAQRIPEETLRKLADRKIAVSSLPVTQRHLDAMARHTPESILTPYMTVARDNIRNMIRAGVVLLMSTDAGIENPILLAESRSRVADTVDSRTKLGEGHFNALVAFEEAGMPPMEVLRSATSHVARAYRLDGEIGTLEPGRRADLVILDADPLASARNYRRIRTVIKDGVTVDRSSLPRN